MPIAVLNCVVLLQEEEKQQPPLKKLRLTYRPKNAELQLDLSKCSSAREAFQVSSTMYLYFSMFSTLYGGVVLFKCQFISSGLVQTHLRAVTPRRLKVDGKGTNLYHNLSQFQLLPGIGCGGV